MVNSEIRSIMFFVASDGEALYSQQKQDRELTMAQIMNSLLANSHLNWRKRGKPLDHSGMCKEEKQKAKEKRKDTPIWMQSSKE